ncbi:hypothetical protein VK792_12880 [Mesobacterium sp. TK19101]|uniref:Uncharacterized protein n=1 Tax=Mesobacterium hydrothermale TaxID=3111907 RepID=A0ABU6HIM4_9RHOB|nr:hypothetical protein [Mesobacterium sp. TK19101]MEC3862181.1 hypothetical protein [Mesobacterium sp. TK19101]
MRPIVRKQTRDDFYHRLASVDRRYRLRTPFHLRRDRRGERPFLWWNIGFFWTYIIVFVAFNRTRVEIALDGSTLPRSMHDPVMATLSASLSISVVFLGYHILRALFRARRYYNSGSALLGFALAMTLHMLPQSYYTAAFNVLDDDTKQFVTATSEKVRSVNWAEVVTVTSETNQAAIFFE